MNAEDTLKLLEGHPLTKKLRAEHEGKVLKERQDAANTLERLRKDAEIAIPELHVAVVEAEAELTSHDAARQALATKAAETRLALARERGRFEREKNAAEYVLLSNYDSRIDQAIEFYRDKFEDIRKKRPDRDTAPWETNLITMTRKVFSRSNTESIVAALKYCNCAIAELEEMRLEPVVDLEKIETLKRRIPEVSEFQEYLGEKPLPPPPPDAVDMIRSAECAGTNDYLLRKLHEKADRLLRRR